MHQDIIQKSREIQHYVEHMRAQDQQRDRFLHDEIYKISEEKRRTEVELERLRTPTHAPTPSRNGVNHTINACRQFSTLLSNLQQSQDVMDLRQSSNGLQDKEQHPLKDEQYGSDAPKQIQRQLDMIEQHQQPTLVRPEYDKLQHQAQNEMLRLTGTLNQSLPQRNEPPYASKYMQEKSANSNKPVTFNKFADANIEKPSTFNHQTPNRQGDQSAGRAASGKAFSNYAYDGANSPIEVKTQREGPLYYHSIRSKSKYSDRSSISRKYYENTEQNHSCMLSKGSVEPLKRSNKRFDTLHDFSNDRNLRSTTNFTKSHFIEPIDVTDVKYKYRYKRQIKPVLKQRSFNKYSTNDTLKRSTYSNKSFTASAHRSPMRSVGRTRFDKLSQSYHTLPHRLGSKSPSYCLPLLVNDPVLTNHGLGAAQPLINLHKSGDSEQVQKDLMGVNGPTAYFKRLSEKYREHFLDLQNQFLAFQQKTDNDQRAREQEFARHMNELQRERENSIRELEMKNKILQQQIYDFNQQQKVIAHQNHILIEENKQLKAQIDQTNAECGNTISRVREETRSEIVRLEQRAKEEQDMVIEGAKREVECKRDALQAQVDLIKDRLKEQNRTLEDKQKTIDKLIRDNEKQDEDYRELLRQEGAKIEDLEQELYDLREKAIQQERDQCIAQSKAQEKDRSIERLKEEMKKKKQEINRQNMLLGKAKPKQVTIDKGAKSPSPNKMIKQKTFSDNKSIKLQKERSGSVQRRSTVTSMMSSTVKKPKK